jgi:hypothetical protein
MYLLRKFMNFSQLLTLNIQHLEDQIIGQYLYEEQPSRSWIIGFIDNNN